LQKLDGLKSKKKMKKLKNLLIVGLVALLAINTNAQVVADFYNPLGTNLTSDTLTLSSATGTIYVTSRALKADFTAHTTIQVDVTKISGTVAGTISLLGSLDGTNFKALTVLDAQTALATITATDATNSYHFRITGGPFLYYRVSWTATTATMSATLKAKIYRNK